jgi:hypothetical protein
MPVAAACGSLPVEVACFCPVDHGMHPAAEAGWPARSETQLLNALEAALEKLAAAGLNRWKQLS